MPPSHDNPLGERVAILETEMKNIKDGFEVIRKELTDQTKKLYYALGGVAAAVILSEVVLKLLEKH